MLNLFLAILLGNFDRARKIGETKKIFDAFEAMSKQGYSMKETIQNLFDDEDFSKYVEEKILMTFGLNFDPKEDEIIRIHKAI